MQHFNYYTCNELMSRHPSILLWKWNEEKIGMFHRCFLIHGKRFGKNKRLMVEEQSFINIMEYAQKLISVNYEAPIFSAYCEILEDIPQTDFYLWDTTIIGNLYKAGLLKGKRSKKEKRNLIVKQSAVDLVQYTGARFARIANKSIKY